MAATNTLTSVFAAASPVDASQASAGADAVSQDRPYGYGYYGSERHLNDGFCRKFGYEKEEHCKHEVRRCDRYRDYSREEIECYEQVERKYRRGDWREYRGY
jgi:hypothetical protein